MLRELKEWVSSRMEAHAARYHCDQFAGIIAQNHDATLRIMAALLCEPELLEAMQKHVKRIQAEYDDQFPGNGVVLEAVGMTDMGEFTYRGDDLVNAGIQQIKQKLGIAPQEDDDMEGELQDFDD